MLANVLDIRTYEIAPGASEEARLDHDLNAIPAKERYEMAYSRGRCWDIYLWCFLKFEVFERETGKAIDGFRDVAMRYLAHQAWAIKEFKKGATNNMTVHGSPLSPVDVSSQITSCFSGFLEIPTPAPADPDSDLVCLAFPFRHRYGVRKLDPPLPFQREHKHLFSNHHPF